MMYGHMSTETQSKAFNSAKVMSIVVSNDPMYVSTRAQKRALSLQKGPGHNSVAHLDDSSKGSFAEKL